MITEVTTTDQIVDTAIGAVSVQQATVVGFDVDDFVSTTVNSIAIAIKMYNMASSADPAFTKNRRKVSVGGAEAGGY